MPPGRGAVNNPAGRFARTAVTPFDDGWGSLDEPAPPLRTTVTVDATRTIVTANDSPDVPFARSINPYRGCEHGCVYCFARPSHAYLDLSPGLDFESRIFSKPRAAELLQAELARPGYRVEPIALGANTDPYQPVERELRITRSILEVLAACGHPVTVVTKSSLVLRDLDLLGALAGKRRAQVYVSITTLDRTLARSMEPRAAAPQRRLETLAALSSAGVPTGVLASPMIPDLNEAELEAILAAAASAGAKSAGYILLRLPHELKAIFEAWLRQRYPTKADKVLRALREMRGGGLNDPRFGQRMRGVGPRAELLARRFALACRRLRLNDGEPELDTTGFRPPRATGQRSLFDQD